MRGARSLADRLREQLGVHVVRAGAGGEEAAVAHELHAAQVDFAVALDRVLDGVFRLREGGRVENHHVELLSLAFERGEQVEHVGAAEFDGVGKAVQRGVLFGLRDRKVGGVHAEHVLCARDAGVQREGAGVREAVEHLGVPAEPLNREPVIFLVEEEAGFLAVLDVDDVAHAVFDDLDVGVEFRADEALDAVHALLEALLRVAALVHAADFDAVLGQHLLEQFDDAQLHFVDAERERFDDEHVGEFVDDEAGQKVRLAENHAAGARVHGLFAVRPGVAHALFEKRVVNFLRAVARHHAHADLRVLVDEAAAERVAVCVLHGNDRAVFEGALDRGDLVVVDPEPAGLEAAALAGLQCDNRVIFHGDFLSAPVAVRRLCRP